MMPGLYPNVAFKDYLALPYVSNSYLGRLVKCPAKAKIPLEDTPSLSLGRAVHTVVLEGKDAFFGAYAIAPNVDKRTIVGKAEWLAYQTANAGKAIISQDASDKILAISNAVYRHPWASRLLAENVTEQTVIWQDSETGLTCKARPDAVPDEGKLILADLKTTTDADEFAFTRSIVKYGYARQAAFYLDGYNAARGTQLDTFIIIAVETEAPYRTEVYLLDEDLIQYGRDQYKRILQIEQRCRAENSYPHYATPQMVTLYKPNYL